MNSFDQFGKRQHRPKIVLLSCAIDQNTLYTISDKRTSEGVPKEVKR